MTVKGFLFTLVCTLTWLAALPLLFAGGVALFGYAVFAEFNEFLVGRERISPDNPSAREIAALICSRLAR